MADLPLDVGVASVHVSGAVGAQEKVQPMGKLNAAQRKRIPTSQYGDPKNKKYPLSDKTHADMAASDLEKEHNAGRISDGKYHAIKRRVKAAQRRFGEKPKTAANGQWGALQLRLTHPNGGKTFIHHQMSAFDADSQQYTAEYDEARGELRLYGPIDKTQALSAEDSDGRVWIQCARTGAWAGHPQGAFRITEQILDAMVENFHREGVQRRQYDFNHASAYPANSGSIPAGGTPAQGWFYDLERRGDKLFALTQWLPLAKQYLEGDQYGGISPLINWEARDRVSNRPVGPLIKSIALTNDPFLLGMQRPTAASASGTQTTDRGPMPLTEVDPKSAQALEAYCYSSTPQLMSQLKAAFGLHELATAQHCSDALANLSSHLDAVDGDATATHEGIKLADYVGKLRDMVGGASEMSSIELIQFIDKILDEYMEENGIENDDDETGACVPTAASAEATTESPVATAASTIGAAMADPEKPAAEAAPAVTPAPAAATETPAVVPEVAPVTETAASADSGELPSLEVARLAIENARLKAELAKRDAKVSELSAQANVIAEQALAAEVDAAIVTYKDTRGLTPELRPHLLSMIHKAPEEFRAAFPAVEPEHQHLLANLTGGGASNPTAPGARVEADTAQALDTTSTTVTENQRIVALGLNGLTDELIIKSGRMLSFAAAQLDADEMLRTARAQLTK